MSDDIESVIQISFEIFHELIKTDVQNKSDLIVAIIHYRMVIRNGFLCLGLGQQITLQPEEENSGSVLLPRNWYGNRRLYELRYVRERKVFVLLGDVNNNRTIILTLLNGDAMQKTKIDFVIEDTVKSMQGGLLTMVPGFHAIISRLQRELVDPLTAQPSVLQRFCTSGLTWSSKLAVACIAIPFAVLVSFVVAVLAAFVVVASNSIKTIIV
ncbi:proteasome inhibitor PI31 subunit-like isoform X2 [Sitodiplosis mosellana]|uniref:proteasome inhibitor PI31 subunit-like isoform X2 n=1 Tax=Sitodiplosis mosellana TaxID=263140 RepID=UPI002444D28A|nr:proteasome inhibitor PI31 subunit-like isoform X2 [Sitodiplosis mosellana]